MLARGDLRDDATVTCVNIGLAGDDVGEQSSVEIDDPGGGLIAGCFDT